jgi:hypothetical protein
MYQYQRDLMMNLSAMPKKKAKLMSQPQSDLSPMPMNKAQSMCQDQSDEPFSSVSHTKAA